MRAGVKMGNASLQDSMVADGLTDAFHGYHMGITGVHNFTINVGERLIECVAMTNPLNICCQLRMWRSSGG